MFFLYASNNPIGFWENKIGDIFLDITIKNLNLNPSEVSLFYYPNLIEVPKIFILDENKNLTIQGKEFILDEGIEYEEIVNSYVIEPVIYAINGKKVLKC